MLGLIENQIIQRLKSSDMFKGMDIEPFPADFENYNFLSDLGCMLIRYNGEDFTEPETLGATVQTDTYSFTIYLGMRSLTLMNEAYPVIKEIKDLLTGYKINESKMYPASIRYAGKINYSDNFWALTFKTKQTNASGYENNVFSGLWDRKLVNNQ